PARARPAQPRLEAVRLVVDAGVDHAAVVAGLVDAEPIGLLHQHHARAGIPGQQLVRRRHPDDAAADHAEVVHGGTQYCAVPGPCRGRGGRRRQTETPLSPGSGGRAGSAPGVRRLCSPSTGSENPTATAPLSGPISVCQVVDAPSAEAWSPSGPAGTRPWKTETTSGSTVRVTVVRRSSRCVSTAATPRSTDRPAPGVRVGSA